MALANLLIRGIIMEELKFKFGKIIYGETSMKAFFFSQTVQRLPWLASQMFNATAIDQGGQTMLMQATAAGDLPLLEHCMSNGAEQLVNHQDVLNGDTALHYAVRNNNPQIIASLLQHGALVRISNIYGETALMIAAEKGLDYCVSMLLLKGADVHRKDLSGKNALCKAAENGHEATIQELLKTQPYREERIAALSGAARYGHMECVKLLNEKFRDCKDSGPYIADETPESNATVIKNFRLKFDDPKYNVGPLKGYDTLRVMQAFGMKLNPEAQNLVDDWFLCLLVKAQTANIENLSKYAKSRRDAELLEIIPHVSAATIREPIHTTTFPRILNEQYSKLQKYATEGLNPLFIATKIPDGTEVLQALINRSADLANERLRETSESRHEETTKWRDMTVRQRDGGEEKTMHSPQRRFLTQEV